jgi:hypothetical protein
MTMQIAIQASDGFVLASDLSTRTTDCYGSPVMRASYPKYETKTRVNKRHGIAFALAGVEPTGVSALDDLDAELTDTTIPADYMKWLEQWARKYADKYPTIGSSFLIVNPSADANRILELSVTHENCRAVPDMRWRLHPDPTNPSNFWPQYLKSQDKPDVERATRIAALTISMASQLSPQGISGLEILQYREAWHRLTESDIDALEDECKSIRLSIARMMTA